MVHKDLLGDKRILEITKIRAAKQQLDCAIELWFMGGDEISIHTLLGAAHQVIYDLNKSNKTSDYDDIYGLSLVKPDFKNLWRDTVRAPQNFFKHADKDPNGKIAFPVLGNALFIMWCIVGLGHLKELSSDHERVFFMFLHVNEPKLIQPEAADMFSQNIAAEDIANLRRLEKEEFFQVSMDTLANMRRAGQAT